MPSKVESMRMAAMRAQMEWIEAHGGTERGYVARYGSMFEEQHYGDGGERIYAADMAQLEAIANGGRKASRS